MGCASVLPSSTGVVARIEDTEISRKQASTGHPQDKVPACYSLPRKVTYFWTQQLRHTTLQDCVSPKPSRQQRNCGETVPSSFYTPTQTATLGFLAHTAQPYTLKPHVSGDGRNPPYLWSWKSALQISITRDLQSRRGVTHRHVTEEQVHSTFTWALTGPHPTPGPATPCISPG